MRALVIVLAVLAPVVADAGPARRLRIGADYRLVFLPADDARVHQGAFGDAALDVGTLRASHCSRPSCMRTVARRRFRLRVDGGPGTSRFVRVRAYITQDAPDQRIRLDGRLLTTTPQLVDAGAPLRVAVAHTLEIEVATTRPAGAIAETVQFIVEDFQ